MTTAKWDEYIARDRERRERYELLVFEDTVSKSRFLTRGGSSNHGRILRLFWRDGAEGLSSTDEIEARLLAQEIVVIGKLAAFDLMAIGGT